LLLQKHHNTRTFRDFRLLAEIRHDSAPVAFEHPRIACADLGGENMSSASLRSASRLRIGVARNYLRKSDSLVGETFRMIGIVVTAATLAACAQTSLATGKLASSSSSRQASSESHIKTSFAGRRNGASSAKEQVSWTTHEHATGAQGTSFGLASSYGEGSQTASGERFNANQLTAAHRTLPFGTRVRVTNRSNGRSVVVTINDRGPFVGGRIIDVTPAAARALGMSGLAPVEIERE
jgi:rare lipoprotein A